MRILIDGQCLLSLLTGIGRVTVGILDFLEEQSSVTEIGVFGCAAPFSKQWSSSLPAVLERKKCPKTRFHRIPLPLGILLYSWNEWNSPSSELLFGKYDIIHGSGHVLPPRKNTPGLMTVHDTSILDSPQWYPKEIRSYAKQIRKAIIEAEGILVPSNYVKGCLVNQYACVEEKIDVVSNPFKNDFLVYSQEEKVRSRDCVFGDRNPYLIWIGEINPRKNVLILPQVLKELQSAYHANLRLVMIGKEGFQSELFFDEIWRLGLSTSKLDVNHSGKHGDVVLTGFVEEDQKKKLIASADCMIFPSLEEGFGYPILEAMSSGIPVVCAKAGALPEIGGEAVKTVSPPDNIEKYVDVLKGFLSNSNEYERRRVLGFERATLYSNSSLSTLLSVYNRFI